MITTNNKISYFCFNFNRKIRKSIYLLLLHILIKNGLYGSQNHEIHWLIFVHKFHIHLYKKSIFENQKRCLNSEGMLFLGVLISLRSIYLHFIFQPFGNRPL